MDKLTSIQAEYVSGQNEAMELMRTLGSQYGFKVPKVPNPKMVEMGC